jgi:hypothetical protein
MPEIQHVDQAKFQPTLKTAHGAAWLLDELLISKKAGRKAESCAGVGSWLVFCPWAHPFWSYYVIAAVHLRAQEGCKPPAFFLPGATHEVFVVALDPTKVPDLECPVRSYMKPINFAGQWIAAARRNPVDQDKAAAEKIRGCVDEILAGTLSPDTDFRRQWIERFSGSNLND